MAFTARDFKNIGLRPDDMLEPSGKVTCRFSRLTVIGQYLGSLVFGIFPGSLLALLCYWTMTGPLKVLVPMGCLGLGVFVVWFMTQKDHDLVELDGRVLKTRHMYTRVVKERSVDDVYELLTHYMPGNTIAQGVTNVILGPIRAVEVRFYDGSTPVIIQRVDPAMENAEEMVRAILYRVQEKSDVVIEMADNRGNAFVRRITRKG